jgi:hypothetical protein
MRGQRALAGTAGACPGLDAGVRMALLQRQSGSPLRAARNDKRNPVRPRPNRGEPKPTGYAIWLAAKSQFTRFQYASMYLARALR